MQVIRLDAVRGADYNPRNISKERFEKLKESLTSIGIVKPILVNKQTNVIIAGHQRTKAMRELGITECPAFLIDNINIQDEARFNQIHNGAEKEISMGQPEIKIIGALKSGYNDITPDRISVVKRGENADYMQLLCHLLCRYGEYGMPISDEYGNVIVSSYYALACKLCGIGFTLLVVTSDKVSSVKHFLSLDYGEFCYDGIKRKTYIQTFAQMHRLKGKKNHSSLYEGHVLPYLRNVGDKSMRILDFGAGRYGYAEKLESEGYNIDYVDPYHRNEGTCDIAVNSNKCRFMRILDSLTEIGPYDVVICDSVLNSVDTKESWYDVIFTNYAMLKNGGVMFISGRPLSAVRAYKNRVSSQENCRFLDKCGFTAMFHNAGWMFQKFDSDEEIQELIDIVGVAIKKVKLPSSYQIVLRKTNDIDCETLVAAVRREFNMPLPNGKSYGLQDLAEKTIRKLYDKNI